MVNMTAQSILRQIACFCALIAFLGKAEPTVLGLDIPSARADRGVSSTLQTPPDDKGAGLIGLKLGAMVPKNVFSPLSPSFLLEIEGGYLLPYLHRLIGITASFAVGIPTVSGQDLADPRVPGGSYSYSQTSQQFCLGLTAWAKIPLGRFVPYIG